MKLLHAALALGLAAATGAALAADPHLGRNLAATCANCHGSEGHGAPAFGIPPLAGMDKEKMLHQLREFKAGSRPATIMQQIAKGYTDQQLELVAAWYAARKQGE